MAACNTLPQTVSSQTASRARPRLRRLRMTRRPVWHLMRTRNPLTRLRLRLVPSSVRLVMVLLVLCQVVYAVVVSLTIRTQGYSSTQIRVLRNPPPG